MFISKKKHAALLIQLNTRYSSLLDTKYKREQDLIYIIKKYVPKKIYAPVVPRYEDAFIRTTLENSKKEDEEKEKLKKLKEDMQKVCKGCRKNK